MLMALQVLTLQTEPFRAVFLQTAVVQTVTLPARAHLSSYCSCSRGLVTKSDAKIVISRNSAIEDAAWAFTAAALVCSGGKAVADSKGAEADSKP